MRRPIKTILSTPLALMAVLLVLPGCARSVLTAPPAATFSAPVPDLAAPPPPSRLSVPTTGLDTLPQVLDWKDLAVVLVLKGVDQDVRGGRYTLHFSKGSLSSDELVSIRDHDSGVLDVQFGPHGTRFVTPVELVIDFAGTKADPLTDYADASEPVLYYLNETTNSWEEVPGTTDWVHLKHIVRLEHFSRYVLGGKAGWKQSPRTETAE